MTKQKKSNHGGARPGAGKRKNPLQGARYYKPYLDAPTVEILRDLGDGNLSLGIRRAARIVKGRDEAKPIKQEEKG